MTDTPIPAEPAPRIMFGQWLTDHAGGALDTEATFALAELVQAVTELGKPGRVTLEVVVTNAGSGKRTVVTAGKVKVKLPEPAAEASIFFVGDGGSLHRDDPYQERLPGTAASVPNPAEQPAIRIDLDTGVIGDEHETPDAD